MIHRNHAARSRRGLAAASLGLLASFSFATGCDGIELNLPSNIPSFDDGAKDGADIKTIVTAERGGTLELPTGAKLTIPAGAVSEDVEVAMQRPPDARAFELLRSVPKQEAVASAPYVLTPHGLVFEKPVRLSLPISPSKRGKALDVGWLKNEESTEWKTLGAAEVSKDTATIALEHFSVVVLMERSGPSSGVAGGGAGEGRGGTGGRAGRGSDEPDVEMRPDAMVAKPDAGPPDVDPGDPGVCREGADDTEACEMTDPPAPDSGVADGGTADSGSPDEDPGAQCGDLEYCAETYGENKCVDTQSDSYNCGGCAPSPAASAGPDCYFEALEYRDQCSPACIAGEGCSLDCGDLSACQVTSGGHQAIYCANLETNRTFCGDCNTACDPEETCQEGACVPRKCPDGQRPCGYFCRDENLSCGQQCWDGKSCVEGSCVGSDT